MVALSISCGCGNRHPHPRDNLKLQTAATVALAGGGVAGPRRPGQPPAKGRRAPAPIPFIGDAPEATQLDYLSSRSFGRPAALYGYRGQPLRPLGGQSELGHQPRRQPAGQQPARQQLKSAPHNLGISWATHHFFLGPQKPQLAPPDPGPTLSLTSHGFRRTAAALAARLRRRGRIFPPLSVTPHRL